MPGLATLMPTLTEYLIADHARLRALLADGAYEEFRAGLLRHIQIEEKVLFKAAAVARIAGLRADHARFAAILAVAPTPESTAELTARLQVHDATEEGPDGVYAEIEAAVGATRSAELLERALALPPVRVGPYRTRHPRE